MITEDDREVFISVQGPEVPPQSHNAAEFILAGRVSFQGRTVTVNEFLQACMPYLPEISNAIDGIRAMRMIEGREFATLEIDGRDKP